MDAFFDAKFIVSRRVVIEKMTTDQVGQVYQRLRVFLNEEEDLRGLDLLYDHERKYCLHHADGFILYRGMGRFLQSQDNERRSRLHEVRF